ncbi:hypothetical protein B0E44_18300, partial [Flavobacterium sp. A45]
RELKYELKFYKILVVITSICAIISTMIIYSQILIKSNVCIYPIFLAIVLLIYGIHVLVPKKLIIKDN